MTDMWHSGDACVNEPVCAQATTSRRDNRSSRAMLVEGAGTFFTDATSFALRDIHAASRAVSRAARMHGAWRAPHAENADGISHGSVQRERALQDLYRINNARKSLTLVWVGPVTKRSPSAEK